MTEPLAELPGVRFGAGTLVGYPRGFWPIPVPDVIASD